MTAKRSKSSGKPRSTASKVKSSAAKKPAAKPGQKLNPKSAQKSGPKSGQKSGQKLVKRPARTKSRAGGAKRASTVNSAPRKKPHKASATKTSITAVTKTPAKPKPAPRSPLVDVVLLALDDIKAVNVTTLDVRGVTDIADTMVIASGNSDRHVHAIAERVVEFAKKAGFRPMGVEGGRDSEWVLVDLTDVIVHVMLPRVREFYRLESLWDVTAARREAAGQ